MFMQVHRLRAVFGTAWRCCGRVLTSVLIVVGLIASLVVSDEIQGNTGPGRPEIVVISIHRVERTGSSAAGRDHEGGQQRKHPPVSPDGPDTQVVIVGFAEDEDKPVITVRRRRRRPGSGPCPGTGRHMAGSLPGACIQSGIPRHALATVRRASCHAISAVRVRGEAIRWPRRRARSWSFSQADACARSIAWVLVSSWPVCRAWRPRAIDVSPRSAITGFSHHSGRRTAWAQYPHSSAPAARRTSSSVISGSTAAGEQAQDGEAVPDQLGPRHPGQAALDK